MLSPAKIRTAPAIPVRLTSSGKATAISSTGGSGRTAYRGSGTLDGNVVTVNWGGSTPVVYSVGSDGMLRGLWDAGRGAEEFLIPGEERASCYLDLYSSPSGPYFAL